MKQGLRKTIFSAISLLAGMALYGQAPINRLYGTYSTETGIAGFVTADSSIYAVGTSSAFTPLSSQVYLVKTDKNGNLLWSKFYGGAGVDDATDMYFDGDSTLYIIANSYIDAVKGYDVKIIKAYTSGTLVWEKNIGSTEWDLGKRLIHMSNNSFVVCGHTYGNSMGLADGMLMAFDENGDSLWFKNTGDAQDNFLVDLRERSADTVVACGGWHTAGGLEKAWLAEYCISTGTVTNYFYGMAYNRTFNAMDTMPNGHYAMGCTTDSASGTQTDLLIMEINPYTHGVVFEIGMYGPNDEVCTDIMFHNGEHNMMGNTLSYGLGGTDVVVYRYDALGNYGGSNTFGTSSDEYGRYIMPNHNNTYTIVGTAPNGFGASDLWIINVDSAYDLNDVPDEFMDINSVAENHGLDFGLKAYPNPCHGLLNLDWNIEPVSIAVYNYTGHIVLQSAPVKTLDLSGFAAGMYLVQVTAQSGQKATVRLTVH